MPLPAPAQLDRLGGPALQQLRGYYAEGSPEWAELTRRIVGTPVAAPTAAAHSTAVAMPSAPARRNRDEEGDQQAELFRRAREHAYALPQLSLLHAIPNGGTRKPQEARRLLATGVEPGVPDVHLPVARGGYVGLWVEMKAEYDYVDGSGRTRHYRNDLTPAQQRWRDMLTEEGHLAVTCYSADEAWRTVLDYLAGRLTKEPNHA